MRGARKGLDRGLHRQKRGLDQTPLPPAAFRAPRGEGDRRVRRQAFADLVEIGLLGAGVEVDRHKIPGRRQATRLGDDPFGILVRQKDVGDSGHVSSI